MKKDEKPAKKVSNIERDEKLEDKGLNTKAATKDDIAQGLKLVLGFDATDKGTILFAADTKGKRHVKISYISGTEKLIDALKEKLEPLQVTTFNRGTATLKRKNDTFGHISFAMNTLEFDIDNEQRKQARELIAEFINEQAAKDPIMWSLVSEIQRAHDKHASLV